MDDPTFTLRDACQRARTLGQIITQVGLTTHR
jgi:hypothetical protein